MKIKTVVSELFDENCYLISSHTGAVIIDPCEFTPEIESFCQENKDKETVVLLTHCHFDHILGAKQIRDKYGVSIMISETDNAGLLNSSLSLSSRVGLVQEPFCADVFLSDGDIFSVGDLEFKVIATPGHTKGSLCYLLGATLFSGDTIFYESFGRVDFPSGDKTELVVSIDKLLALPTAVKVYSGHGITTTIGHEREYNPYKRYFRL